MTSGVIVVVVVVVIEAEGWVAFGAVGKAAIKALNSELRAYLEPVQVGVGTRLGAETVVHVARQWLGRNSHDPSKVLLLIELPKMF